MDEKLTNHLKKQIKFLQNSSKLYDEGDLDEAIRIAATLRVIMYDNNPRSPSLLKQLGTKGIHIILTQSSSVVLSGEILHWNMGIWKNGKRMPCFGEGAINRHILLNDWLNQKVAVMDENLFITKEQLIKFAAHKDGGAHVDIDEPEQYTRLKEFGIEEDEHFIALRQMAYEFLESIKDNSYLQEILIQSEKTLQDDQIKSKSFFNEKAIIVAIILGAIGVFYLFCIS